MSVYDTSSRSNCDTKRPLSPAVLPNVSSTYLGLGFGE